MFCSICYLSIDSDDGKFKCMNNERDCNGIICEECLESYINHIHSENLDLVKCPKNDCKFELGYSTIVRTKNKELIHKYEMICFSRVEKEYKNEAILEINRKKIIEKIRNERHEFMKQKFPKAILYVVENSLKTKLKKIKRDNFKHIEELKKTKNTNCPNIYCLNGILDKHNCCIICFNTFCPKCDKIKKDDDHLCDENELKTKEMLKEVIKCPKCSIAISRSEGCNHMTCAVCKTMFIYTTGEESNSGSHNKDVNVREIHKQSVEFEKDKLYDLDTLNVLRKIEEKVPSNTTGKTALLSLIKEYLLYDDKITESIKEKYYKKIASKYEYYLSKKYYKTRYYKMIAEIQKLHDNKKLTKSILDTINSSMFTTM